MRQLAILGGDPAFNEQLHVGRPNIGDRKALYNRIEALLNSKWLTNNGHQVREFEAKIAELVGCRHCIAVCNATVALEIVARAAGMTGEVIVPSFTFVATAHALNWIGITPVFCDIDPVTHNLDPAKLEALITPRTSGVIGVHVWGRPCAVEQLSEICNHRGLALVYDAAHAFACSHGGAMIGNFGRAEVFSFHATKFLNSFEGGAVVTNDDALAAKVRLMKNFGFAGYDKVVHSGTNGKMTEVCAAMGLTSLECIDHLVSTNRANYQSYREGLAGTPGIKLAAYNEAERNNYQYVVLEVDAGLAGVTRDQLVKALHAEGVLARRYFYPGCHQMEPYQGNPPAGGYALPETVSLANRVLVLPNGTSVEPEDVGTVCGLIKCICENAAAVRAVLGD